MIRGVTDKIHQLPIFFADTSVNRKDIPVYKKCLLREHDIIYIYIYIFFFHQQLWNSWELYYCDRLKALIMHIKFSQDTLEEN